MTEEILVATLYTPAPYWGCPKCGANTWGAINPLAGPDEQLVYRCHGYDHNNLTMPSCGTLFTLPGDIYESEITVLIEEA